MVSKDQANELGDLVNTDSIKKNNIEIKECILVGLNHPIYQEPIKVGIVKALTRKKGSNVESIANAILNATKSQNYHIIVAPEYSFLHAIGPLSALELDQYIEQFKEASANNTLIIPGTFVWKKNGMVSNTAFGFYKGETIFEYTKIEDGGTSDIAKEYCLKERFGPIDGNNSIFDFEGLKLGIEICADGGELNKRGIHDRDLLFLISCCNSNLKKSIGAVKKGGYGVVVDGMGIYQTFYKAE
jgi:predicted amidohydrolase